MLKWVLSLTVALVVAGSAKAQPLADRVPGDALIYIGWSGSDSMGPGYAGSHLEAVLKDSKLSELVNEALPRLFKQIAAKEPGAAEPLAMFLCGGDVAAPIGVLFWRVFSGQSQWPTDAEVRDVV
jgi:hypothetical protein